MQRPRRQEKFVGNARCLKSHHRQSHVRTVSLQNPPSSGAEQRRSRPKGARVSKLRLNGHGPGDLIRDVALSMDKGEHAADLICVRSRNRLGRARLRLMVKMRVDRNIAFSPSRPRVHVRLHGRSRSSRRCCCVMSRSRTKMPVRTRRGHRNLPPEPSATRRAHHNEEPCADRTGEVSYSIRSRGHWRPSWCMHWSRAGWRPEERMMERAYQGTCGAIGCSPGFASCARAHSPHGWRCKRRMHLPGCTSTPRRSTGLPLVEASGRGGGLQQRRGQSRPATR